MARLYGSNNLPDSSNMCHETTSVALKEVIGVPVGTVVFDDLAKTDLIFFFGQNPGTNSPRFLHPLRDAAKRGAEIITFNPVLERGLEAFRAPQSPVEMLTGGGTRISTQYHQVRPGGDIAAILGICKHVFAADDAAKNARTPCARRGFPHASHERASMPSSGTSGRPPGRRSRHSRASIART